MHLHPPVASHRVSSARDTALACTSCCVDALSALLATVRLLARLRDCFIVFLLLNFRKYKVGEGVLDSDFRLDIVVSYVKVTKFLLEELFRIFHAGFITQIVVAI